MARLKFKNLDETRAFATVGSFARVDVTDISPDRVMKYESPGAEGLRFNFAAKAVDETILSGLAALASEQAVIEKYRALADGEIMNTGERRMVLHHLARGRLGRQVTHEGRNIQEFYQEQLDRVKSFARRIHSAEITGSTGKSFTDVVQIGIGGSDLGPRALAIAMENWYRAEHGRPHLLPHFISNVDPDDAAAVVARVNPETTLFIVVSKSGTTQETLANEAFVRRLISESDAKKIDPTKHIVAVTSESSPMAKGGAYLESFFIDDFIGGRYSSSSAVGAVVLSIAFGPQVFQEFLRGAHAADRNALEPDILKNPALLDALIGVYERNVLGYPTTAVLPYSQALSRFPAHLQQLDMESNGKSVNRDGVPVRYATGPVVFGEPGTNGQHSFYQLLHQGTDIVPLQFIGFRESQLDTDIDFAGSSSQTKLNANLAAQVIAFARGKSDDNPNKSFAGGRPSSVLYAGRLSPSVLGALLAHYENKVMFQGFVWNVNSFDQEGVQLGKELTKTVLEGEMDATLSAYASRLGIG